MMALTTDKTAKVKHHAACLVSLPDDGDVGVLKGGKLLLVPLAFALKLFGNLLLEHEGLESVVTLLLRSAEANGKAGVVILLLVEKTGQTSVLTLVRLDLALKILRLLGELLGKGLEFEELRG